MASKSSLILLACGSFNPITNMHLRLFELAKDTMNATGRYDVTVGYISPVHDSYKKEGLISSEHRLRMCRLAIETSNWIRCSDWECRRDGWSRTVEVLRYIKSISTQNLLVQNHPDEDVHVKLLCGADLLESFATPDLWSTDDLKEIVEKFGLVCIDRHGSDPRKFIYSSDLLWRYENNIHIVTEWIPNEISSTCVRRALRRQQSIKYLIPDPVADYIYTHSLYSTAN